LALQRTHGNRAVAAFVQAETAARARPPVATEAGVGPPAAPTESPLRDEAPDEVPLAVGDDPATFLGSALPVVVAGETHSIEYRLVDGRPEIGIATTWVAAGLIHDALRPVLGKLGSDPRAQTARTRWEHLRKAYDRAKRTRVDWTAAQAAANAAAEKMKKALGKDRLPSKKPPNMGLPAWEQVRKLNSDRPVAQKQAEAARAAHESATSEEKGALLAYTYAAIDVDDNLVAEILGSDMPPREKASAVGPGTANVRYHTGTVDDPIPIVWYKPLDKYPDIPVTDASGAAITLKPFVANPPVVDALGHKWTFGVAPENRPSIDEKTGTKWRNMPVHGKQRVNQVMYNAALANLGHDPTKHGEDGDHVRDLGFGGNDEIKNYWPLEASTNRLAYTGWRGSYYLHYKKDEVAKGSKIWNVVQAPLNSGNLIGKWIRTAKPAQAVTKPEAGPAAGSSTSYGNPETIRLGDGTDLAES
jgi:hypothetical protein